MCRLPTARPRHVLRCGCCFQVAAPAGRRMHELPSGDGGFGYNRSPLARHPSHRPTTSSVKVVWAQRSNPGGASEAWWRRSTGHVFLVCLLAWSPRVDRHHGARADRFALSNPTPKFNPESAAKYASVGGHRPQRLLQPESTTCSRFPGLFRARWMRGAPHHRKDDGGRVRAALVVKRPTSRWTRSSRAAGPARRGSGFTPVAFAAEYPVVTSWAALAAVRSAPRCGLWHVVRLRSWSSDPASAESILAGRHPC